jgi:hypothetical protein
MDVSLLSPSSRPRKGGWRDDPISTWHSNVSQDGKKPHRSRLGRLERHIEYPGTAWIALMVVDMWVNPAGLTMTVSEVTVFYDRFIR